MYPTDLTDSQWQVIQDLLADQRKRKHDLRKVFNALFYVVKGGIPWRQMPTDLPPWKTPGRFLWFKQARACNFCHIFRPALQRHKFDE